MARPGGPPVIIKMRCIGGEPAPPAVLAPKTAPLGMSPKKLGDDIAKATMDWKGLGVMYVLVVLYLNVERL